MPVWGLRFLKHIERCRVLLHLVDLAQGELGAAEELEVIETELGSFDRSLLERPRLIVGSKLDAADDHRRRELATCARQRGLAYHEISAVSRAGLDALLRDVIRLLDGTEHGGEARSSPGGTF